MTTIDIVLRVHIAGGVAALASLWIPMVASKGGRLHRRAGWVFVAGMAVVSLTTLALSAYRYFFLPPYPASRAAALFLGYLALLTGAGTYRGIRVLRTRNRTGASRNPIDLGLAAAAVLAGPPVAVVGYRTGFIPLAVFGILGPIGGLLDLRYWLRAPQERMHWWYQHMSAMVATSIAALTAFLVLNRRHMGFGLMSIVLWVGPTVIGVPLLRLWVLYYRRLFSGTPAVAHHDAAALDHVPDGGDAGADKIEDPR
jgi:uncharacterized membrane protein